MKNLIMFAVLIIGSLQLQAGGTSLQKMIAHYLDIHQALAEGDAAKAQQAGNLLKATLHIADDLTAAEQKVYGQQFDALMKSAHAIADTLDLEEQREAFAVLSPALWSMVIVANELEYKLYYYYCPMRKAYWISDTTVVENPYYGSAMLTCGSIKETK